MPKLLLMLKYRQIRALPIVLCALASFAVGSVLATTPPKEPAKIAIQVEPMTIVAGEDALIELTLTPKDGIKINKYPKIKLEIPEMLGVHPAVIEQIGEDAPPPIDRTDDNYYGAEGVPPVQVRLPIEDGAAEGRYELDAKLTYFYCVKKSGFCAPAKIPVIIGFDVATP